jgi:tRNA-2-methylthio-N6-dimethylallyladenosine synthase
MPRYALVTFGCQMNVHDSERMLEVLHRSGYDEAASNSEADVIILNTCSVRERAEQKLLSELGRLVKLKRERPDLLLVVAGCVAQQEGEKLLSAGRGVDLVMGPDNIPELPRLLADLGHGAPPFARTVFDLDAPQFLTAESVAAGAVTAFVTTMKGCDERCSFCIVPTTRGPERYRPSDEVVREIRDLVAGGVREVTLLGQTVNSYRDPLQLLRESRSVPARPAEPSDDEESEFALLLRRIAHEVPGLLRLRYTSPHPRHLGPSLIDAHAELACLPRHVHMPVQSGSDRMLKRMIRRYTRADYQRRIDALRARVPGLTVSTDVIVGFPGETESDFAETLDMIRDVGFIGVFGFKYSQRPFTPALKLGDDVTEAEKGERLARLFEVSEKLIADRLVTLVGSSQEVLIEGPSKRVAQADGPAQKAAAASTSFSGRSGHHEIVHIDDAAAEGLVGEVVSVRITRALKHSLVGELDAATRARGSAAVATRPARTRSRRALTVLREDAP